MKIPRFTFKDFIERFQLAELPVTLTEEALSVFSASGDPLPESMIAHFITFDEEQAGQNTFVEYFPCFRVPETHDFHAIVYCKGDLMKYHYILATYDKKGKPLHKAIIAGIESDGKSVLRSVATLEEDWIINIVEGEQPADQKQYDPVNSRAYQMELLATGEIVMLVTSNT